MTSQRKNKHEEIQHLQATIQQQEAEIAQLRNVLDNLPGSIFWKNKDGVYLGVNAYAIDKISHFNLDKEITKDFVVGKDDYDIFPNEMASLYKKNDAIVLKTKRELVIEESITLPNGKTVFALAIKRPLKNAQGDVVGLVINIIDITHLKKIESNLQTDKKKADIDLQHKEIAFENILSMLPGNIYWKDTEGKYLGCNAAFAKTLKLRSTHEIIGKTDADLLDKDDAVKIRRIDQEIMRSNKRLEIEEIGINKYGKPATYLAHKTPMRDANGEIIGLAGISIDISRRKTIEKQLQKAKERAEVANKAKTEFMLNMEHDLRTPSGGIYGLADILCRSETDPEKQGYLQQLAESSKELLDLLDDILRLHQIESGKLPSLEKRFSPKNVIESIVKLENATAKQKGIHIINSIGARVPNILIGDEYRLKRILLNLVSNAVKFTHEGFVKITTNVIKTVEKNIVLQFVVEDTGIGIEQAKQNTIYDKFTRLTPSNRGHYKGYGLGLYIVKQFIDELDGNIDIESQQDDGTKFTCLLSFKLPSEEDK